MASTIKLKNGSGAPLAGDLVQGEPALDLTNKRLYTEDSLGNVIEVGINPSSLTIGGTALTATAAELNTLDGITATTAELNTLDGITATVTELNYTDGVTSNIQTQLNTKAPIASPTFTGTVTAPAVNVNGTVTADDGIIGTDIGYSVSADANLTIGATNVGSGVNNGAALAWKFNVAGNQNGQNLSIYEVYDNGTTNAERKALGINTGGDISFYEDTGTTPKFFWDASAERLGIGTTSPSDTLEVKASGNDDGIRLQGSGGANVAWLHQQSTDAATFRMYDGSDLNVLISSNANANSYFNTGGNVGIGTTSPTYKLHVTNTSATSTTARANILGRLQSNGAGADVNLQFSDGVSSAAQIGMVASNIYFASANTERARIDSSGNLLVGKTSSVVSTDGIQLIPNGVSAFTRTGAPPLYLNRSSSDGTILDIRKDNTTVGSISAYGGDLGIGTGDTRILFDDANDRILPRTTGDAARDAAIDLGASGGRFKDLYLSGGVYLGGTGAANLLDDYEEGTFTPVVEGTTTAGTGTYSYQFGYYTKIGREVKVYIRTAWTAHTGTGNMIISGLPFTSFAANGYTVSVGSINIAQVAFPASTTSVIPVIAPSSTQIQIASIKDNLSNVALQMDSSCPLLTITISYFV